MWGGSFSTTSLSFRIHGEDDETPGSSATISDHEDKGSDGLSRWILVLCKNQGHSHIKLSSMRPDVLRTLRRINRHCHIPQNSAAINFSWFGGVGWCKLFWPPDDYENFLQKLCCRHQFHKNIIINCNILASVLFPNIINNGKNHYWLLS